jgi:hypothetical protein
VDRNLLSSGEKWAAVERLGRSDYALKSTDFTRFNGDRAGAIAKDMYNSRRAGNEPAIGGIESAEYVS